MNWKKILEPTAAIFIVTVFAYGINLTYEIARLRAYGVDPSLAEVKVQNFLTTGAASFIVLLLLFGSIKLAHLLIEEKLKGKEVVEYGKAAANTFAACCALTICLALLPFLYYEDDGIATSFIPIRFVWLLSAALALFMLCAWLFFWLKAMMRKITLSKQLEDHIRSLKIPFVPSYGPLLLVGLIALVMVASIVSAMGSSQPSTFKEIYSVKKSDDVIGIIITTHGDDFVLKNYNHKTKSYEDGFYIEDLTGKTITMTKP